MSAVHPPGAPVSRGNRIWRVHTPTGNVLQKLYSDTDSWAQVTLRATIYRLLGSRKTSPRAVMRSRTERSLLAHWRAAGVDVPRDLTDEHPELVREGIVMMEEIPGRLLDSLLGHPSVRGVKRETLLRRFARSWGFRHGLALERDDPELVHEHATMKHVIADGERMVTIDLEHAHSRTRSVTRLLAAEILGYLRSLAKRVDRETFRGDLAVLVAAYPHRPLLAACVREYTRSPSPWRRLVWRLDRAQGRSALKYRVVEDLATALREHATAPPEPTSA